MRTDTVGMERLWIITAVASDRAAHLAEVARSVTACAEALIGAHVELGWSICVDGHSDGAVSEIVAGCGVDAIVSELGAHMGVSVARNAALAASGAAPTDWVLCLDGDDVLVPEGVTALVEHLDVLDRDASRVAWVGSNRVELDGSRCAHWLDEAAHFEVGSLNATYVHPFAIHPNSVAYRAWALDEAGGWPATPGGEDLALWLRVARSHPGEAIAAVTLRYRRWDGQVTANGAFAAQRSLRYGCYTRWDLLGGRDPLEMRRGR